jgi:hypothetical protein
MCRSMSAGELSGNWDRTRSYLSEEPIRNIRDSVGNRLTSTDTTHRLLNFIEWEQIDQY